jgi:hypothetical protein
MVKYLSLWFANPNAPWPTDPVESAKLNELAWASLDHKLQTGDMEEIGFSRMEDQDMLLRTEKPKISSAGCPDLPPSICEPHEVVPYETAKEVMRGVLKAQPEAMKR